MIPQFQPGGAERTGSEQGCDKRSEESPAAGDIDQNEAPANIKRLNICAEGILAIATAHNV